MLMDLFSVYFWIGAIDVGDYEFNYVFPFVDHRRAISSHKVVATVSASNLQDFSN